MNTFVIQYWVGLHCERCFISASTTQAAVNKFRADSAASIHSVYLLLKQEVWE